MSPKITVQGAVQRALQRSPSFHPQDTAVVTPYSDTAYSILWLDLRAEPFVLTVPAVPKSRYYSVHLCDGSTFNYGFIGTRATGPEAGDYLVVGARIGKATRRPESRRYFIPRRNSRSSFTAPSSSARADLPNVAKVQAGASIGIGPDKTFDFRDLSPEHKAIVLQGMKVGDEKVDPCRG